MPIKFIKPGSGAGATSASRSVAKSSHDGKVSKRPDSSRDVSKQSAATRPRIRVLRHEFSTQRANSTVNDPVAVSTPMAMIPRIISVLDQSYHGFVRASQLYNYEFFVGETSEFKVALIQQLCMLYPKFHNSFWNKVMQDHSIAQDEAEAV